MGDSQLIGKKTEQGRIGGVVGRWGLHGHFQCPVVQSEDASAAGAGGKLHLKEAAGRLGNYLQYD